MPRTNRLCRLIVAAGLVIGCERSPEDKPAQLVRFDTATVTIFTASDTVHLRVEVADSDEERSYGLMDRDSLPRSSGMLFLYDSPRDSSSGFWMFRTRIPLDIAFMDTAGVIVAIRAMEPCPSPEPRWCTPYRAGQPYQSALEVNRGFLQEHGITTGARVVIRSGN